ncbi:MAG: macro domain-containing protein [Bacteroidota bacterium]
MKHLPGDVIQLARAGTFEVIVHGCNCFCTMGAGIAKTIKQAFPAAYQADLATVTGDQAKLGTISFAEAFIGDHKVIIVNGYTQYHFKGPGRKVDYDAVRGVFAVVKSQFSGLRIGYPAIGAGLGGGDWKIISRIIDAELAGEDHTFVQYRA